MFRLLEGLIVPITIQVPQGILPSPRFIPPRQGIGFFFHKLTGHTVLYGPYWAFALLFIILVLLGVTTGRFFLRRRLIKQMSDRLGDVETAFKWRRHETSVAVTYWLLIMGFSLFVAGVTGTITLELPGAKVVTSLPGLAIIYLAYRMWVNAIRQFP